MKIAEVAHLFYPATGGIEHHVFNISKQLVKLGEKVTVFTTKLPGTKDMETMEGFSVRRFFSINFPLFSSVRFSPSAFMALLNSDYDVYSSHGYGSPMPLCTSLAAAINGKPFVFTLHGYPKLKGRQRFFQLFYKYFFASIFLRIARKVIVVSRSSIEDIGGEVDPSKIVYVPNGIDEERFESTPFEGKNVIAYIGRLDEYKGVDALIRAFARLKRKYPDLELWLVGKDEGMKKKLQKMANELGVQPSFMQVPYDKMGELYSKVKCVVLPSKYEGFSLVWLEAMASGKPMFSTPVGDAPLLFEQAYGDERGRFLFEDENGLVERLIHFMDNQGEYRKIAEKAEYIVKEEYSWENVARITDSLFRELVE